MVTFRIMDRNNSEGSHETISFFFFKYKRLNCTNWAINVLSGSKGKCANPSSCCMVVIICPCTFGALPTARNVPCHRPPPILVCRVWTEWKNSRLSPALCMLEWTAIGRRGHEMETQSNKDTGVQTSHQPVHTDSTPGLRPVGLATFSRPGRNVYV